jgi:hypothetical protein
LKEKALKQKIYHLVLHIDLLIKILHQNQTHVNNYSFENKNKKNINFGFLFFFHLILDSDRNFHQPKVQQQQQEIFIKPERSPSPKTTKQQPTAVPTNMGSSNQKQQPQQKPQDPQPSSFVHLASEAAGFQAPPPARSTTPILTKVAKTAQEKIDEICVKLENLEKDVNNYSAPLEKQKKDKKFLLIEENLTQCLLQLDEIERHDDKINQLRRKLIGSTHRLIDLLESKFNSNNNENIVNDTNNVSGNSNDNLDKKSTENLKESSEATAI